MYSITTKKPTIRCVLFICLLCFNVAGGSNEDICNFNGFIAGPNQWEKNEFKGLLQSDEMPNYKLMVVIIGKIAVTDIDTLQSTTCNIFSYVEQLISFYDKHKAIIQKEHPETADLLDYIKTNLKNAKQKDYAHENTH